MIRFAVGTVLVVAVGCSNKTPDPPAPTRAVDPDALGHLIETLRETKAMPSIVTKVREESNDTVVISVTREFFKSRKAEQKSLLHVVWLGWATKRCPGHLDGCYLKAEDQLGNKVGGSGFVGSLISLEDE